MTGRIRRRLSVIGAAPFFAYDIAAAVFLLSAFLEGV